MARFNPWLGTQVGSVGDLVTYRRNGKQVQRVRVRNIANPRTEAQAKNRAVLATMGAAYSYMQGIVDHSFQNKNSKSENMQEFQKLNQGIARSLDNAPAFDAQMYNYNFKGESVLRPNPYAIARGTLPAVQIVAPGEGHFSDGFTFGGGLEELFGDGAADLTYTDVAALFGVELGSQVTICIVSDDTFTGTPSAQNMPKSYGNFHFCRIILSPDDGDGNKKFWSITASQFTVNNANSKNQGSFYLDASDSSHAIVVAGQRYPLAVGVILSNYNSRWLRSNTDMVVAEDYVYSNGMAEVFNSYMDAVEEQPSSRMYLNQSQAQVVEGRKRGVYIKYSTAETTLWLVDNTGSLIKVEIDGTVYNLRYDSATTIYPTSQVPSDIPEGDTPAYSGETHANFEFEGHTFTYHSTAYTISPAAELW